MTSFKTTKRLLYCTPFDVRLCSRLVEKKDLKLTDADLENFGDPDDAECISDAEIEHYILVTDGMIRARLSNFYSEADFKLAAPIVATPISSRKNTIRDSKARLMGVLISTAAITEQWMIVFDQVVAEVQGFQLWGSFSGNQGIGNTSTDFTSTNADIIIDGDNWFFEPNTTAYGQGDKIYFATYNIDPRIVFISCHLTCASVLRAILSDQTPNYSGFIDKIESAALKLLDDLATGKTQLSLTYQAMDADAHGYHIDSLGVLESERLEVSGSEPGLSTNTNFDRDF